MSAAPVSEHDWTIHSINIHGGFFERHCRAVLLDRDDWILEATNYPVEYPPPNGPLRGEESELDIRACLQQGEDRLTLLVECKKNNPDLVNWIFFPVLPERERNTITLSRLLNSPREAPQTGWVAQRSLEWLDHSYPVADEARETRCDYLNYKKNDKTRTSNVAITEAAYQIALASQHAVLEGSYFSQTLGDTDPPRRMPWHRQVFLPTIVTTARLFICDFNPRHVDRARGEIPYDKASSMEVPHLVFRYPLPCHLLRRPADLADTLIQGLLDRWVRMDIMVVQSEQFPDFLDEVTSSADRFFF